MVTTIVENLTKNIYQQEFCRKFIICVITNEKDTFNNKHYSRKIVLAKFNKYPFFINRKEFVC